MCSLLTWCYYVLLDSLVESGCTSTGGYLFWAVVIFVCGMAVVAIRESSNSSPAPYRPITARVGRLETDVAELKEEVTNLKAEANSMMAELKEDLADLKAKANLMKHLKEK